MRASIPPTQSDSHQLASRFRWIPHAASASAVAVGGLVLVGWWLDVGILKAPLPEYPAMMANTALAFVLIGVALWLLRTASTSGRGRRLSRICASIVALIGLLTLSEYLFVWDLGIGRLPATDFQAPAGPYHVPGRIAFASALNFVVLGAALLLLDVKIRGDYRPAEHLAVTVAAIALLTLVAYLYGGTEIHQLYPFTTVAPHTALLFVVLSIGVLFARSQHRIVSIMMSDTVAAAAMRRLLVVAILLPISAGWVRLIGQRFGLFGTEFGLALIVVFAIVALTVSVYWQATSLIQAEEYQCGINEISVAFSGTTTIEDTFPVFATIIKKIASYDRICVVARDGEKLVAIASWATLPLQCFRGKAWRPSGETAVEWVMDHKTPRLVRDLPLEQRFADEAIVVREGIRSTLVLPLMVGGEAVGTVTLDNRIPGAYTSDSVTVLTGFMEPLAAAVRNAELHAQVVRYTHELEDLVEARTRELQTANGHLAEASRHKSIFLTNMSHELRTPLNSIIGFSELLRNQTAGPLIAKQARYIDHIYTSGQHLLVLINDLLDLSKVEAGKLVLHPEPIALSEALAAAVQDIRPLTDTKRLTLTLDVDTAPITIAADPVRFKQIIYNMLSNAVKFTPEEGRITVTARRVSSSEFGVSSVEPETGNSKLKTASLGEFVEITVADTGIGIAAEDLSRLFARFSQIEIETTKRLKGSGLGLVLTRQLVELHGGTIAIASDGPGQGSTCTVRLPLAPQVKPET
ncbi:MAG: GAF domain-containing sensor histidine kinase [Kofleriaceae bacterium]|nr:GAF domain-containing sensor histidine kinase [Candidatus Methylomirabilis lanthanidiphila]